MAKLNETNRRYIKRLEQMNNEQLDSYRFEHHIGKFVRDRSFVPVIGHNGRTVPIQSGKYKGYPKIEKVRNWTQFRCLKHFDLDMVPTDPYMWAQPENDIRVTTSAQLYIMQVAKYKDKHKRH